MVSNTCWASCQQLFLLLSKQIHKWCYVLPWFTKDTGNVLAQLVINFNTWPLYFKLHFFKFLLKFAHFNLCICSVSLICCGAVCDIGENRRAGLAIFFSFALWLSLDLCEYWWQLQHCSPCPNKITQPRVLQYSWCGNEVPPSSSLNKGSTDFGITWCTMLLDNSDGLTPGQIDWVAILFTRSDTVMLVIDLKFAVYSSWSSGRSHPYNK